MKIKDVMSPSPEACRPDDNLATAAALLWKANCGVLPVTDHSGRIAGIITDRDVCIALGTRNARASDVLIGSVMRTTVQTCEPEEDVLTALARMSEWRVRRLPVVDGAGRLAGIFSLNDAVLAASPARGGVRPGAVLDTFKAVCAHELPAALAHSA